MRDRQGITLLELLVALAILGLLMVLISGAVVNTLKIHNSQEVLTASSAKLRRVGEVVTQDLRSAVLGGIANQPYVSGEHSVSFMLLDGGAGYQILPHDSGSNHSFVNANNVDIIAPVDSSTALALQDSQALMVNANGDAVVLDLNNVQQVGGSGSFRYRLVHPACSNTIDFTPNTSLFKVRTLGYSYDKGSGTLFLREGGGAPQPLAFELDDFQIEYVYVMPNGMPVVFDTPRSEGGVPARNSTLSDGTPISLSRLQIQVRTEGGGQPFSALVELIDGQSVSIERVLKCA